MFLVIHQFLLRINISDNLISIKIFEARCTSYMEIRSCIRLGFLWVAHIELLRFLCLINISFQSSLVVLTSNHHTYIVFFYLLYGYDLLCYHYYLLCKPIFLLKITSMKDNFVKCIFKHFFNFLPSSSKAAWTVNMSLKNGSDHSSLLFIEKDKKFLTITEELR